MVKHGTEDSLHDIQLHCKLDGVAVPEIHTGQVEVESDLDCPEYVHGICYDTVAVPEINLSECMRCCKAH